MSDRFFYDADGELLIVPQLGRLRVATELGILEAVPQEVLLIPRGLRFRVELPDGEARESASVSSPDSIGWRGQGGARRSALDLI